MFWKRQNREREFLARLVLKLKEQEAMAHNHRGIHHRYGDPYFEGQAAANEQFSEFLARSIEHFLKVADVEQGLNMLLLPYSGGGEDWRAITDQQVQQAHDLAAKQEQLRSRLHTTSTKVAVGMAGRKQ